MYGGSGGAEFVLFDLVSSFTFISFHSLTFHFLFFPLCVVSFFLFSQLFCKIISLSLFFPLTSYPSLGLRLVLTIELEISSIPQNKVVLTPTLGIYEIYNHIYQTREKPSLPPVFFFFFLVKQLQLSILINIPLLGVYAPKAPKV